ncbi:helix-turn-helix domain-containing protein [Microlunatus sp. Gsoil 973]|uniref:helix-turn-helix domain-containing protein n=1 Tax=Microlunatus sp. Gsoil 973 TaxID=2672569 RepID=UPI0012B4AAC3|nr:helix-turn-helix domain-containing protein [Microlunatus sp. Gsoil 973]QGN35408.1 HTH domain-containing protein [Microlunatus sp. Gsoil 973]
MEPRSDAALGDALQSDDPAAGLGGVVALRVLADQLEFLHVQRARERGWSWQEIAQALGVSRQAVHKKYGRRL